MNRVKKVIIIAGIAGASTLMAGGAERSQFVVAVPETSTITPIIEENFSWGYYIGAGASRNYLRSDVDSEGFRSYAGTIIGGLVFNKYAGIEGRYSASVTDVDYENDSTSLTDTAAMMSSFSFLLKVNSGFKILDPYLLLGYGFSSLDDISIPSFDQTNNWKDDSFQYGVGLQYRITDSSSLFIDYLHLSDGDKFGNAPEFYSGEATIGFTYEF